MSEYPDTMDYPNAYEIDCNGELLLIMPLINNEALMVLLHSRSKLAKIHGPYNMANIT